MSRQLLAQVFNKKLVDFNGEREKYDYYLEQKERYANWLAKDTKSSFLDADKDAKKQTITLILKQNQIKTIDDIPEWWFLQETADSVDTFTAHPSGNLIERGEGTDDDMKRAETIQAERLFPNVLSVSKDTKDKNYLVVGCVKEGSVADFCDVRAGFFLKSITVEGQGTFTPDVILNRITREQVFSKAKTSPSLTMEFTVNELLLETEIRIAIKKGWNPGRYNFLTGDPEKDGDMIACQNGAGNAQNGNKTRDTARRKAAVDGSTLKSKNDGMEIVEKSMTNEARALREEKRKCLRIRYIIESEERLRSLMDAPWNIAVQNKNATSGPLFTSEGQVFQHPFRSMYSRLLDKYSHLSDFDLAEGNIEILREVLNLGSTTSMTNTSGTSVEQMMYYGGYEKDLWRKRAESLMGS